VTARDPFGFYTCLCLFVNTFYLLHCGDLTGVCTPARGRVHYVLREPSEEALLHQSFSPPVIFIHGVSRWAS
jgi:hypothetical protein